MLPSLAGIQNPVSARACGFESHLRYQETDPVTVKFADGHGIHMYSNGEIRERLDQIEARME